MTKTEFICKREALFAEMKNLEGEALNEKTSELNTLTAMFNAESAELNRETPKNKVTLVSKIREALKSNERTITVQGYTPAGGGQAVAGVHGQVIEEDIQGILEPLYAKSVLSELGVRWFAGLPQGDIKVPIMGKNSVGWESEIGEADATGNTFTSVTLKPKRLSAYIDLSKQLLMQDTVGAEEAIRRDLVKALSDKLEATVFGDVAGDSTKPAGIFYNQNLTATTTFAGITALECGVEENGVYGNCKYLLSPKAKADLRAMAKSAKTNELVLQGMAVDGTPAIVSGNVNPAIAAVGTQGQDGYVAAHGAAGSYVYGDFSNIAVGSWGNIEIGVYDDSRTATAGVVRLVVNAYFDVQVLRSAAFAFGKTRS